MIRMRNERWCRICRRTRRIVRMAEREGIEPQQEGPDRDVTGEADTELRDE